MSTTRRLRRFLTNVALLALALILAAGTGEQLDRLLAHRLLLPIPHEKLLTEYDSLLGWRKRALASGWYTTDEYSVLERTNAHGLRGPDVPLAKRPGEYRALFLGDSFTEGYSVDLQDHFLTRLQRLVDSTTGDSLTVINGGTAGYSTDQEVLFYLRDGRRYHPDVTVLMFYENDVWYNIRTRYWRGYKPMYAMAGNALRLTDVPVPPPPQDTPGAFRRAGAWLGSHCYLCAGVQHLVSAPPHTATTFDAGRGVPDEFLVWKRDPPASVDSAWNTTEALLSMLDRRVRADGSTLLVFYIPSIESVYDPLWRDAERQYRLVAGEWTPEAVPNRLMQICARQHLACIDPTADFRRAARAMQDGQELYYRSDGHWNRNGHALAAALLAGPIARAERRALPAGRQPRVMAGSRPGRPTGAG